MPLRAAVPLARRAQRGATLLEVLVSVLITSFGLLALAGLQVKMNAAVLESYQRAQALTLVNDMANRIEANMNNGASYIAASTAAPAGTDNTTLCTSPGTSAAQDLCDWSNALKGAAETSGGANAGAMIGGRGCIQQVQAANAATGVCQPAIYQVTVAWQGLNATVVPAETCGATLYGSDDTLRKAVSLRVVVPLLACS